MKPGLQLTLTDTAVRGGFILEERKRRWAKPTLRGWMWEPKMIWSFIVWFYYAGAMHAYYLRAWRGRALSVATVFGFFVALFTYLGVSLLMKSSHSF